MEWNILIIIGTLGGLMWWMIKPVRDSLSSLKAEVSDVRKDVKQNSERIARIEGIIWTDIDKVKRK